MILNPSWPSIAISRRLLGHLHLLQTGAYTDKPPFLDPLTLQLPEGFSESACTAGALLLTDDEGAPAGVLEDIELDVTVAPPRVHGRVRPIEQEQNSTFSKYHLDVERVRKDLHGKNAAVVSLSRPLTKTEESALATSAQAAHETIVFLVCTAGPGPNGVPAEVTVRSALASASNIDAETVVATVPLVPEEQERVLPQGIEELTAALGARLLSADESSRPIRTETWHDVISALDVAPDELAALVSSEVAELLQRWRPPRDRRGLTVFFTGLSGSGKSTIARGVTSAIQERSLRTVTLLDGDVARQMLSAGLSFSKADRELNIRRIGWVAAEVTRHGGIAICAPIAPYASTRAEVKQMVEAHGDFVLVYVATPLDVCERRDRKGLYAKARAGLITEFTGISDPYDEPSNADLRLDTSEMDVGEAIGIVLTHLERNGWLSSSA